MENGILVLFAQGATVAFLGKQDDWLPKDWYLAHALTSHRGQNFRFTVKRETVQKLRKPPVENRPITSAEKFAAVGRPRSCQ
jgi:hypothetical protein